MKYLSDTYFGFLHLSDLVLQKWFFRAMLMSDSLDEKNFLIHAGDLDHRDPLMYVRFVNEEIINVFFGNTAGGFPYVLSGIALHMLIPLLLAYVWLRKTYS